MNVAHGLDSSALRRTVGMLVLFAGSVSTGAAGEAARPGASGGTAVGFSAEPKLVAEGKTDLPVERLLKRGVSGTVTVEVDLDQTGTVEGCRVRSGIDPELDSAVVASMRSSRFSPAYERGSAVPSTVSMQFSFNPGEVVRNSAALPPVVYGTVVEGGTAAAVAGARVNLQLTDSLADQELAIAPGAYLELIGEVPGQSERSGILTTVTDSLGRFAFRLLPSCPARMAVTAGGYEVAHARVTVTPGVSQKITCRLEPIATDTSIDIVVYGSSPDKSRMDIEEEQLASGLTHYLSDVLKTRVTIRSVPESRSRMMVRAGSPFDNRYYVCGVPMLAPFHFGGHSYADIDGLMISALSEINLTIDGIAGRQIDASGFRIDAEPGIYRPANRKLIRRPEVSVDFSTIGQDFLLSLPRKKTEDALQLGFTRSENWTFLFFDSRRQFEENEYGSPRGYGNVTVSGVGNVGPVSLHSFSWFAWDTYDRINRGLETIPWGMSSITLQSPQTLVSEVTIGGSRQYFASGKRAGSDLYYTYSSYTNGTFEAVFDTVSTPLFDLTVAMSMEMLKWKGSVSGMVQEVVDSVYKKDSGAYLYLWKDTVASKFGTAGNREISLQMHSSLKKTAGRFTATLDVLGAGVLYEHTPDLIGDAGISLVWKGEHVSIGCNGGRVTARPDIRGLPDARFRKMHCGSYLFSMPVQVRSGPVFSFGVQPYIRKKTNEPKLHPVQQVWMTGATSGMIAAGADIDGELKPFDWLALYGAVNLARSYREIDGKKKMYEWDIPWTGRGGVHLQFGEISQMHFYLNGITAKGLPFYDFIEYGYIRAPDYFRLDFSMQYRSRFIDHRYITRYDAYFDIFNLTNRYNATDFFWDQTMRLHPIPQSYMTIEMGVRFGFRA